MKSGITDENTPTSAQHTPRNESALAQYGSDTAESEGKLLSGNIVAALPFRNEPHLIQTIESSELPLSHIFELEVCHRQGRMSQWLRTLRKKSRLPQTPYDIDGDNERESLGFSSMPGSKSQTCLSNSSVLIHTLGSRSMSVATVSCHPSISQLSQRYKQHAKLSPLKPGDPLDKMTVARSRQRRQVIEEIISTEEVYLADLRALTNVYEHATRRLPTFAAKANAHVKHNIVDLVEIHELLLSNILQSFPSSTPCMVRNNAGQLEILDVSPDIAQLARGNGLAEPNAVRSVCEIFEQAHRRFFAYIEYAAKYTDMVDGIRDDFSSSEDWRSWETGFEMLANSTKSSSNKALYKGKKAATLADLLIKPIQRVTRYPLLLRQLLKYTPVVDCPESSSWLEEVCSAYGSIAGQVDDILSTDGKAKEELRKTWLLRERLVFDERTKTPGGFFPARVLDSARELGRVLLCGALYVAWNGLESLEGAYMACILYSNHLVLATATNGQFDYQPTYAVELVIPTRKLTIAGPQSGRGFQCPNTPFSWKLFFEADKRRFEIILCASSSAEEGTWRNMIQSNIDDSQKESNKRHAISISIFQPYDPSQAQYSIVPKSMKAVRKSFRTALSRCPTDPGLLSPRSHKPLDRLETKSRPPVVPTVYILNTDLPSEHQDVTRLSPNTLAMTAKMFETAIHRHPAIAAKTGIQRSNSVTLENNLAENRIYTLSPQRSDRGKLEYLLDEVWSTENLGYPKVNRKRSTSSSLRRAIGVRSSSLGSLHSESGVMIRKLSMNKWSRKKKGLSDDCADPIPSLEIGICTPSRLAFRSAKKMKTRSSSYTFESSPPSHGQLTDSDPVLTPNSLNIISRDPFFEAAGNIPDRTITPPCEQIIKIPKRNKSILHKFAAEKTPPSKTNKAQCWWLIDTPTSTPGSTAPTNIAALSPQPSPSIERVTKEHYFMTATLNSRKPVTTAISRGGIRRLF